MGVATDLRIVLGPVLEPNTAACVVIQSVMILCYEAYKTRGWEESIRSASLR